MTFLPIPPIKFVPATSGKFKPMQRVRIARDHEFNKACASYPHVGMEGNVVVNEKVFIDYDYEKDKAIYQHRPLEVPEGKLAVRFSSKALGYLDNGERPFTVLFIDEGALEAVKKRK